MDAISDDHEDDEVGRTLDLLYTTRTLSRTLTLPTSYPTVTLTLGRPRGGRVVTVAAPRGPRTTVLPYYRTTLLTWHSGGAEHACACFCGYVRRGMWLTCAGACGLRLAAGHLEQGRRTPVLFYFSVFSGFNMMCKSDTFDPSDRAAELSVHGERGPRPRQQVLHWRHQLVAPTRTRASDTSSRARGTRSRRVRLRANGAL